MIHSSLPKIDVLTVVEGDVVTEVERVEDTVDVPDTVAVLDTEEL
jgi:hypothetical protein